MEKLLAFHFSDTEFKTLRRAARSLQIPCEAVDPADYTQTLEALAAGRKNPAVRPHTGGVPEKRLILICDLSDKRLDALLAALKKAGVQTDYKAVLTASNRRWTVLRLLLALDAEAGAYASSNQSL